LFNPAYISESYSTWKAFICRNHVNPNPWGKKQNRKGSYESYYNATLPPTLWLQNSYRIFPVNNLGHSPFIDDFFIVYLDDILIFSRTWNEHVMHVKRVLDVLKKEKLYVKLSKCDFGKTSLVYLGHIVGGGQLKIDPSKVEVIVNLPKPT
jgi:hypothetical protein